MFFSVKLNHQVVAIWTSMENIVFICYALQHLSALFIMVFLSIQRFEVGVLV